MPQWWARQRLRMHQAAVYGLLLQQTVSLAESVEVAEGLEWRGVQVDHADGTREIVERVFGAGTVWVTLGLPASAACIDVT
jgi:hypothetical protein